MDIIQGNKPEKKPLGPRLDYPKRTYEGAIASQRLLRDLMNVGPAEDVARHKWAGRSSEDAR
jgi:hypothetical protein